MKPIFELPELLGLNGDPFSLTAYNPGSACGTGCFDGCCSGCVTGSGSGAKPAEIRPEY